MSQVSAQTTLLGLGGTSKDISELYAEIFDLRQEEDALYTEIIDVRNEAILGVKDKDGNIINGPDGKPITKGDFYGPKGAKLVKRLMELGARTANRVGKVKKAYYKEVAEHKKKEEEEMKGKFKSVKDITAENKKGREAESSCDACGGVETDEDVKATMDLVRTMLNMK